MRVSVLSFLKQVKKRNNFKAVKYEGCQNKDNKFQVCDIYLSSQQMFYGFWVYFDEISLWRITKDGIILEYVDKCTILGCFRTTQIDFCVWVRWKYFGWMFSLMQLINRNKNNQSNWLWPGVEVSNYKYLRHCN